MIQSRKQIRLWVFVVAIAVAIVLGYYYLQSVIRTRLMSDTELSQELVPVLPVAGDSSEVAEVKNLDQPIDSRQDVQASLSDIDSVNIDYLDSALQENDKDAANL